MAEKLRYSAADDVKGIGDALINEYHHHLLQEDTPIIYLFRSKPFGKKTTLAQAKVVAGAFAIFFMKDVLGKFDERYEDLDNLEEVRIIEVVEPYWTELTGPQRIALVDHELCHFAAGGGIRDHDLEEFRVVIERHGYWAPDRELFAKAVLDRAKAEKNGDAEQSSEVNLEEVEVG